MIVIQSIKRRYISTNLACSAHSSLCPTIIINRGPTWFDVVRRGIKWKESEMSLTLYLVMLSSFSWIVYMNGWMDIPEALFRKAGDMWRRFILGPTDRTEKNEGNMLKNWLKCQRFKYSVLKLFNSRITKPVYSNDIFVFLFLRLQYYSWSRSAQSSSLLIPQYAEQENGG